MAPDQSVITVTIDGPAGAGKSTVARGLAHELGYSYLDTGAMYRALTLKALRSGIDLSDEQALALMANDTDVQLDSKGGATVVKLDGIDVSEDIRTLDVTRNTSHIASKASVREVAVGWQREYGASRNIVVEGRDIGSVVFPEARFKIYLDAEPKERARRRADELTAKGQKIDLAQLASDIEERDRRDMTRAVSPLIKPENAINFDSTGMTVEEVVTKLAELIRSEL